MKAGESIRSEVVYGSRHWRMESYLMRELPRVLAQHLPARADVAGIRGHSMGGHGALTLALGHPGRFRSVSAFVTTGISSWRRSSGITWGITRKRRAREITRIPIQLPFTHPLADSPHPNSFPKR